MPLEDPSPVPRALWVGLIIIALLGATIWSVETSKTDVAVTTNESAKPAPTPTPMRTLDPVREARRLRNARADELRDLKNEVIRLNKSLGVLFVRGVAIDHATLALTIDGSIWDNETEPDKANLNGEMATLWSNVYNKYNSGSADLKVRLYDMDGRELKP